MKTIGIVSLSAGTLGEPFVAHELAIGTKRLESMGCKVKFLPNALKGIAYLKAHPEKRAQDLLEAYRDPEIDMILCAIGGDDTYRLLPYLFGKDELKKAASKKTFLGFSDTTVNHFMLHKLGIPTFYGQSFLADVCELEKNMLPYTEKYFRELLQTGTIREVRPSDTWYEERTDFGADQVGVPRVKHPNEGFQLLQGCPQFEGEILGGCVDTMFDFFDGTRYPDMPELCRRYELFPQDWQGKILLLESCEEKMKPEKYRKALEFLKEAGVLAAVNGILVGKPMDEAYLQEYHAILREVVADPNKPILANLNIGHATPRCILPFGVKARVDAEDQAIYFG